MGRWVRPPTVLVFTTAAAGAIAVFFYSHRDTSTLADVNARLACRSWGLFFKNSRTPDASQLPLANDDAKATAPDPKYQTLRTSMSWAIAELFPRGTAGDVVPTALRPDTKAGVDLACSNVH